MGDPFRGESNRLLNTWDAPSRSSSDSADEVPDHHPRTKGGGAAKVIASWQVDVEEIARIWDEAVRSSGRSCRAGRADLLDPREEDFVAESTLHHSVGGYVAQVLKHRYQDEPTIAVWSNLEICFVIPGLTTGPGPQGPPGPAGDLRPARGRGAPS
ncbi:MAG: hypothetical protein GY856_53875 [bacterium]|nr:hypothetical protein [bacterium]